MKAILLDKPMPDEYPEVHFDVSGIGTWVQFEDEQYEDWIGVFGHGDLGNDAAVPFDRGSAALISARGKPYVIDVNKRTLLFKPDNLYVMGGITVPEHDFVLAWSYTDLFAIGTHDILWHRVGEGGTDEMQIIAAHSDHALGRRWHGDYYDFTLYYDGWQFIE